MAATFIGYLVFAERLRHPTGRAINSVRHSPVHITVIAVAVVILLVIGTKAYFGSGTPLRGGLPSGHAAVAFGGWMAITFVTQGSPNQVLVSTLGFIMALLVAQSRVEAGIHTRARGVVRRCAWARWSPPPSFRPSPDPALTKPARPPRSLRL